MSLNLQVFFFDFIPNKNPLVSPDTLAMHWHCTHKQGLYVKIGRRQYLSSAPLKQRKYCGKIIYNNM